MKYYFLLNAPKVNYGTVVKEWDPHFIPPPFLVWFRPAGIILREVNCVEDQNPQTSIVTLWRYRSGFELMAKLSEKTSYPTVTTIIGFGNWHMISYLQMNWFVSWTPCAKSWDLKRTRLLVDNLELIIICISSENAPMRKPSKEQHESKSNFVNHNYAHFTNVNTDEVILINGTWKKM